MAVADAEIATDAESGVEIEAEAAVKAMGSDIPVGKGTRLILHSAPEPTVGQRLEPKGEPKQELRL